jgi:hypothetical protein
VGLVVEVTNKFDPNSEKTKVLYGVKLSADDFTDILENAEPDDTTRILGKCGSILGYNKEG